MVIVTLKGKSPKSRRGEYERTTVNGKTRYRKVSAPERKIVMVPSRREKEEREEFVPQAYRLHFRIEYDKAKGARGDHQFFLLRDGSYIEDYSQEGESEEQTMLRMERSFRDALRQNFNKRLAEGDILDTDLLHGLEKTSTVSRNNINISYRYRRDERFKTLRTSSRAVSVEAEKQTRETRRLRGEPEEE